MINEVVLTDSTSRNSRYVPHCWVGAELKPPSKEAARNSPIRATLAIRGLCLGALFLFVSLGSIAQVDSSVAPGSGNDTRLAFTPPMGWNSWDGYGTSISENEVKANARWIADHLKAYGWQYVTVDMEWFVENPTAEGNSKNFRYSLDKNGRYTPPVNRFPSAANGTGFRPLADYVHSLGLKFGIHILRGIPKQAVAQKMPIADSSYTATEGADVSDTCPWNFDNFGTDASKPAAQAYYDSIAKLYAEWDVDLVKVDCIASRPYKGDDIRMMRQALDKAGRPIVLSLSPGAAPIEKYDELKKYAEMWRISDDIWDIWHSSVPYPQGLGDQFANLAKWAGKSEPGHWPDADMLPLGFLGPAPGWGKPRPTGLTHDEQKSFVTLWAIFRSPLMVGGDLTKADDWTTSLLTNGEVIAVNQRSMENRPVIHTNTTVVWTARPAAGPGNYIAIFNIGATSQSVRFAWKDLGLAERSYRARDLWEHKDLAPANSLDATLASHGCVLLEVSPDLETKSSAIQFSDQPQFQISGVVDPTNYGGHGSDAVLRTKEALARDTDSLGKDTHTSPLGNPSPASEAAERHRLAGDTAESQGHALEAVHEYELAAESDASEPNLFAWGAELLLHRAFEPAVEVFTKGHHQFPGSVRIAVGLAIATYDRGDIEAGKELLVEACDIDPANTTCYLFIGRLQEAEKTLSPNWVERLHRFAVSDPDNPIAHYSYAVALSKQSPAAAESSGIQRELERAIQLDPKLGKAYLQLGIVLAARNDRTAAISAFQKAIATLPLPDEAHYRLAQLYRQAGKTDKARQEIALFNKTSQQSTNQAQEQRHELQQFVYTLRQQPASQSSEPR